VNNLIQNTFHNFGVDELNSIEMKNNNDAVMGMFSSINTLYVGT
jgi:hypothetical protein